MGNGKKGGIEMNIYGYKKRLKEISKKIKEDGETSKLKKMKEMYKNLILKERGKKGKKK